MWRRTGLGHAGRHDRPRPGHHPACPADAPEAAPQWGRPPPIAVGYASTATASWAGFTAGACRIPKKAVIAAEKASTAPTSIAPWTPCTKALSAWFSAAWAYACEWPWLIAAS